MIRKKADQKIEFRCIRGGDELATEFEGKVDIYKVDVDAEEELARLFKVRSIPTLVYIPTEGLPIVEMGGKGKGELKEKLNALK